MKMQRFLCVFLFVMKDSGTSVTSFIKNLPDELWTDPRAMPFSDFRKEMGMSHVITVTQRIEDNRVEAFIRCTSDEELSVILNFEDFSETITSMINSEQLSGLPTSTLGFNFFIVSDVDGLYSVLNEAHQIDRELGAGSLLRHFSKWLIVLTSGAVDSLILDDVLFDNLAVTTLQAMTKPVKMLPFQLSTLMWKNSSRQLQQVSRSPSEHLLTRVFPNTKHGLNGRLLTAAVLQWETCQKKIVNGTFTYTGVCDYFLSYLTRSMNFSYTYIEPADKSWGVQHEDGTWDGIIRMLIDGTADLCPIAYEFDHRLSQYVTFLRESGTSSTKIIYKKPESRINWTVLLDCFQWRTYVCGLVVFVWVSVLFVITKKVSVWIPMENHRNTFLDTIMTTFGVPFKQGSPTLPVIASQRILVCFWWLFCILITSVYCGNFVADLSETKEGIPITGLDDLLESGYDVGVITGVLAEATFKDSSFPLYRRIGEKIREHQPENMTPTEDFQYHYDRLIQGDYALLATTDRIRRYTANRCDIAATDNRFFQRYQSYVLPKYSPLAGLINQRVMSLVEQGLVDYWRHLVLPEKKQCSPLKQRIFKVDHLFLVLVVSGIGVTISTAILVLENCGVCRNC